MRPIIFLDCDGVLNCVSTTERSDGPWAMAGVDRRLMPRFEDLVRRLDALIVISSTWRMVDEMESCLRKNMSPDIEERIIGMTPHLGRQPGSSGRACEIQAWLAENEHGPFVILDDYWNMAHLAPHHVLISSKSGLQDTDCERARELIAQQFATSVGRTELP